MRVLLSVLWLALAAVFFTVGRQLSAEAAEPLPPLELQPPSIAIQGEGFSFELSGSPLDQPFEQIRDQVETWTAELETGLRDSRTRAATACYGGAVVSLLALALVWRRPAAS